MMPNADQLEIRRLQKELSATADRLRLHLEQTPAAILEVRQDGRATLWNRAAERMFGWSREEMIGCDPLSRIVPDDLQGRIRDEYARMWADPVPLTGINRNITKCGDSIHCEWHNTPLVDAEGRVIAIASLALDVTERIRATEALRSSEERFALALRGTSDGIWDSDLLTGIVRHSERYWSMLGYSAADILDRGLLETRSGDLEREHIHPKDVAQVRAAMADHLAGRTELYEATFRIRCKTGDWLWVLSRACALRNAHGTVYRMVGAHTDIDQRIRLEQQLRAAQSRAEAASRSKTLFLANMSHELRTPLNAIIGFSEMIASQILGPVGQATYAEYGRHINDSGKHLLSIINDVLDMSKIEAGKLELRRVPVEARLVAQACANMVSGLAGERGIRLDVELPDGEFVLLADERAVKQIILNLLSNAIKFSRPNGVARLSVARLSGGGAVITVTDSGIGMEESRIGQALEPFSQLNDGLARNYAGTGLGLSIVNGLVRLHGGRLEVESALDSGTSVRVTLPEPAVRQPAHSGAIA